MGDQSCTLFTNNGGRFNVVSSNIHTFCIYSYKTHINELHYNGDTIWPFQSICCYIPNTQFGSFIQFGSTVSHTITNCMQRSFDHMRSHATSLGQFFSSFGLFCYVWIYLVFNLNIAIEAWLAKRSARWEHAAVIIV